MPATPEQVDARNRRLFAAGERIVPRLPRPVRNLIMNLGAEWAVRSDIAPLRTWATNIELATGESPGPGLRRQAIRSWLRTYLEVLALPSWRPEQIAGRVSADPEGERVLRLAHAGPGVVCALPHSGNWDLAGGWAASTGLPVSSVAERLGEAEFAAFTRIRAGLGIDILAHDDPGAVRALIGAVRAGRVVCLMADREFGTGGVAVRWNGRCVIMPAGPALVARRTGAVLLGVGCHYTAAGMKIEFSDPIEHRAGRTGLAAMTQDLADWFSRFVAAHPADWHVMQPFFDTGSTR